MALTYEPIQTTTLTSAQASVTFSSISGGYTDLIIIVNGLLSATDASGIDLYFNGGTGTNRSYTRLQGNGTAASSARNTTDAAIGVMGNSDGANLIINIMNYSNTTTNKTVLSRYNSLDAGDGRVGAYVSLWQSTSAITSLVLAPVGTTFASGCTFTLYGIKSF